MRRLAFLLLLAASPAAAGPWTRLPSPPLPSSTPVERGRIVFQDRCAICHGTDPDAAGTASLRVKYGGAKPALLEQRTDLTPETVKYFVRHGSGMMAFLRKTEVSDAELDDLAAYLSRPRR
jgi:mono/diheme cytochrome c family protein